MSTAIEDVLPGIADDSFEALVRNENCQLHIGLSSILDCTHSSQLSDDCEDAIHETHIAGIHYVVKHAASPPLDAVFGGKETQPF